MKAAQSIRRPGRVIASLAALTLTLALAACDGISGEYTEVGGPGKLEFKGSKVYVTTVLGMTFAAEYEVDGSHLIIKGAGGSQVYTIAGDTLDGGAGMRFVKKQAHPPVSVTGGPNSHE